MVPILPVVTLEVDLFIGGGSLSIVTPYNPAVVLRGIPKTTL
jgi:hypothetical protein